VPVTYFPQINSGGVLTQRPYQGALHYATSVLELPCGLRQQWGWRGHGLTDFPTGPLGKWELNFQAITDAELAVLRTFFDSMRGRYGEFAYLDPSGNLVPYSEDFSNPSWSGGGGSTTTDPFGGNRARSTSGTMSTQVLPSDANGIVLGASIWAKGSGSGQTVTVTVAGSSKAVPVPNGSWIRADHSATVSGSGAVSVSFACSASMALFGAQCVPMRGPGGYMRTPGNAGLHLKCRFDTDTFSPRYLGPNQISLKLPIMEYF
jgi:hypothetical protein